MTSIVHSEIDALTAFDLRVYIFRVLIFPSHKLTLGHLRQVSGIKQLNQMSTYHMSHCSISQFLVGVNVVSGTFYNQMENHVDLLVARDYFFQKTRLKMDIAAFQNVRQTIMSQHQIIGVINVRCIQNGSDHIMEIFQGKEVKSCYLYLG